MLNLQGPLHSNSYMNRKRQSVCLDWSTWLYIKGCWQAREVPYNGLVLSVFRPTLKLWLAILFPKTNVGDAFKEQL